MQIPRTYVRPHTAAHICNPRDPMTRCEEDHRTPGGHSQLGIHQDKQAAVSNKLENKDQSLQVVFGLTQCERAHTP